MIEPPIHDEHRMRQIEERRHAQAEQFVGRMFGPERAQQHVDGIRIRLRQMGAKRPRDMTSAIQQLQRIEPGARVLHERIRRKLRMRPHQIRGKTTNERRREKRLESVSHAAIIPKPGRERTRL